MPQVIKNVQHTQAAAWSELDGAPRGIQNPPKDLLPLAPATITFAQLLNGHRFLQSKGCIIRSREHLINHMHNAVADVLTSLAGALCHPNEVIDKDINVSKGALMQEERGTILGLRQHFL